MLAGLIAYHRAASRAGGLLQSLPGRAEGHIAMGMKGTCGTCKYRGKRIAGMWMGDAFQSTYFLCTLIKHANKDGGGPYKPGLGAGVQDGSGYHAALCVEQDFGCVKWEQSE